MRIELKDGRFYLVKGRWFWKEYYNRCIEQFMPLEMWAPHWHFHFDNFTDAEACRLRLLASGK